MKRYRRKRWKSVASNHISSSLPQSFRVVLRISALYLRIAAVKSIHRGSARRNFTSLLFSWSHQATGPVRLDTSEYLWFGWIIPRTPRVPCAMPVWPVRGPCVTRKGAVRRPFGHVRELTQPELAKIPHGRRIWPHGARTGPLRSPHGLFTGCLWYLNPYGARKLIMLALKLYGPQVVITEADQK